MKKTGNRFISYLLLLSLIFPFSFTVVNYTALADDVFSEDFESYTAGSFPGGGWASAGGTWAVAVDGSKVVNQSAATTGVLYNGDSAWENYSVSAKVKCVTGGTILGRYQDYNNYYMLKLSGNYLYLQKKVAGSFITLDKAAFSYNSSAFYTIKLEMNGDSIRGYVDGVQKVSATDLSIQSGKIALRCESICTYDDVAVYQMLPTVTTAPSAYPGLRDINGNVLPTPVPHAVTGITRTVNADIADNANDDRPAIEASINAAEAGDEVYLPDGIYNLNSPSSSNSSANINLKSGVNIRGQSQDGVILKTNFDVGTNDSLNYAVIKGAGINNVLISNLTVTSSWNRQYSNNYNAQNPDRGGPRNGIQLIYSGSTYTYNVTVDSVTVEKFAGYGGVILNNTHDVVIKNSDVKNATEVCQGGYGINLSGANCYYNVIDNCNLIGVAEGYLRHGILFQSSHNNLIKNNTLSDVLIDAIDFHGEDEYSNEVCGNNVSNAFHESAVGVGNPGSTHDASGPNNWIHNNLINKCLYGIRVFYGSANTVIQNNELTGVTSSSSAQGIVLGNAPNAVVQGNYIHENTATGYQAIMLKHDKGSVWADSTIHNPGDPTAICMTDNIVKNNYSGIRIEAGYISTESNNTATNNTEQNYFKVINPGFENDGAKTQTPAGWSKTGTASASFVSDAGAYSGTYELRNWSASAYNVTTFQTVAIPNNTYTLKARVRTSGGLNTAAMTASGFGGNRISQNINFATSGWVQYQISNIDVTNGSCTIGFSVDSPAGKTLEIDNVELINVASSDASLKILTYTHPMLGTKSVELTAGTYSYNVILPYGISSEIPQVAASPTNVYATIQSVTQAAAQSGSATIVVKAENNTTSTYTVNFSVSETPQYGDVSGNGVIDISDVIMAAEIAVGDSGYTAEQKVIANVNSKQDPTVDISDVVIIAERAVGGVTAFPVDLP